MSKRQKDRYQKEKERQERIKETQRKERHMVIIKRLFSFILLVLTIATLIELIFFSKTEKQRTREIFSLIQYIAMSLILISPRILKKYHFEVPIEVHISVTIFAFLGLVLGDGLNFYGKIHWWDSLLHFTSGIILSFVALWLIRLLIGHKHKWIFLNKVLLYVFICAFSLAAGAFWEICEYTVDDIFHTNNQQFMATTRGTIITDKDKPLEGHAALADTMKDLALDLVGSIVVVVYECSKDSIKKKIKEKKIARSAS